jgi:tryptophan synthase alpha chain
MSTALRIEESFRMKRSAGRKLLVPYITGGYPGWERAVEVAAARGADAIEIGIPFSDPVMDGPVIQEASLKALQAGVTPLDILSAVPKLDIDIPVAVMCYYNTVFRMGDERFAQTLTAMGVSGAILPDLPLEESGSWCTAADAAGVETIMLAAPTAPDDRLPLICDRASGFVYAIGLLGTTGERSELAQSAIIMATRLKAVTDKPVLVGVGVSNAQQAQQACQVADGVIMGASVVRRLIEGGSDAVGLYVGEVRDALDS